MEFPRRPSRNEDPWYSAREAYDQAIESSISDLYTPATLTGNEDLDKLSPGRYRVVYLSRADSLGLPRRLGILTVTPVTATINLQVYESDQGEPGDPYEMWVRGMDNNRNYHPTFTKIIGEPPYLTGNEDLDDLLPGKYRVAYLSYADSLGLPRRLGVLTVIPVTTTRFLQRYETYQGDVGGSYGPYEVWVRGMDDNRNYYPTFTKVVGREPTSEDRAQVSHTVRAPHALSEYVPGQTTYDKNGTGLDRPASTTKLMTLLLAFREFNSSTLRQQEVTIRSNDPSPGGSGSRTPLREGDVLTVLDLMLLTLLPSHNKASAILGRFVGESLDPNANNPYEFFVEKMNQEAAAMGLVGAIFENTHGRGNINRMSCDHLVTIMELLHARGSNPRSILATQEAVISVKGPNARDIPIRHTVDPDGDVKFPEMKFAKTGTLTDTPGGHACLAMCWENSDGSEGYAAVLGSNSANRYRDMRQIINYAKEAPDKQYLV